MPEPFHLHDLGTVFRATVRDRRRRMDLSEATRRDLVFTKPSGAQITVEAAFVTDGKDGKVFFVVISTDFFDEVGVWTVHALITVPGWSGKTGSVSFRVDP